MSQKLTRRQWLQLLAVATGAAAIAASTQRGKILNGAGQGIEGSASPSPAAALPGDAPLLPPTGTRSPTGTATSAPTETAIPPEADTSTPAEQASNTPAASQTPAPETGTFTDGPGGDVNTATDTLISSSWPTRNGGMHANFQLDGAPGAIQNALLKFDLSPLPKDAVCTGAKLYLYHSYDAEGAGWNTGKVYSIAAANWPWVAGSGDIDIAREGEPCWKAREADGNEGVKTPWAGSEGCSTPGMDYEASPIGEWSFRSDSPKGTEIVIELNTSRVQEWFGSPNTNYGILLITDPNTYHAHVGSAQNPAPEYRPKLVVTYA